MSWWAWLLVSVAVLLALWGAFVLWLYAAGRATDAAVAERTGLGVGTVAALRTSAQVTSSLDAPIGDDGTPLAELVADSDAVDAWEHADERDSQRQGNTLGAREPQQTFVEHVGQPFSGRCSSVPLSCFGKGRLKAAKRA